MAEPQQKKVLLKWVQHQQRVQLLLRSAQVSLFYHAPPALQLERIGVVWG